MQAAASFTAWQILEAGVTATKSLDDKAIGAALTGLASEWLGSRRRVLLFCFGALLAFPLALKAAELGAWDFLTKPIDPDMLPHIFEPFRSGARDQARRTSFGLGLYIVREIVRAHGGEIEVVSDAAAGSSQ